VLLFLDFLTIFFPYSKIKGYSRERPRFLPRSRLSFENPLDGKPFPWLMCVVPVRCDFFGPFFFSDEYLADLTFSMKSYSNERLVSPPAGMGRDRAPLCARTWRKSCFLALSAGGKLFQLILSPLRLAPLQGPPLKFNSLKRGGLGMTRCSCNGLPVRPWSAKSWLSRVQVNFPWIRVLSKDAFFAD